MSISTENWQKTINHSDMSDMKGTQNIVTGCLSQPVTMITIDICDLNEEANNQETDEEIKYST